MQTWTGAEGGCGHVLLLSDCITVQQAPITDGKFRIYGLKILFQYIVTFIQITVISNINYI